MPTKKKDDKSPAPVAVAPNASVDISPVPSSSLTYTDNCKRGILCEGRNYGVGFALCKKNPDGSIHTVGPVSPCKDYLSDQVYSEQTGKPYQAWGYKAKKEGIFDGVMGFVAFGILPYFGQTELNATQTKERDFLAANFKKTETFIVEIEKLLGIKLFNTEIMKVADNRYVAQIPDFWCKFPYRISLWSLLVRFAIESFWVEGDPIKAIEKCRTGDGMMFQSALPKLKKMINGEFPVQNLATLTGVHDAGIVSTHY